MKGKCLQTIHYFKDYIWYFIVCFEISLNFLVRQAGPKTLPPNITITEDESDDDENAENAEQQQGKLPPKYFILTFTESTTSETSASNVPIDSNVESEKTPENTPTETNDVPVKEGKQEEPDIDHDSLLLSIFMEAIKTKVKDRDLPLLVSQFYSSIMLPCRPPGTTLDIKKTQYKKVRVFSEVFVVIFIKLSAFLSFMERHELVTIKDDKGVQYITSINRSHPE